MFIGKYELENKEYFNIYYKNKLGYEEWHKDTFSPLAKNIETLDFKISGRSYKEKQNSLYQLAVDYQLNYASLSWSYGELSEICNFFETNGRRYGLLKEFKENCIC